MSERHERLGYRAELLPKQQRLRVECEALRERLRIALPTHVGVEELNAENILATAIALTGSLGELAGLNRQISSLEEQLGLK